MNESKWQPKYKGRCLYRSREGWFLGVCQGLADFSGLSVGWIRLAVVLATIASSFLPVFLVYIVVGICLKPEPVIRPETLDDWDFYNSYAAERGVALAHLKQKLDDMERRARRIETVVTARGFDWDRRFRTNG